MSGFPRTGDTVYWADGSQTILNLEGVDLLTSPFPNADPAFFGVFGENWAQKPDEFAGVRGIRQSLVVDSETITNGVSSLLREMVKGDNEWGLPPFEQQTDLLRHAIAATKFPQGWAASDMRRKYLPGSVATDPQPRPDAKDAEIARLEARVRDLQTQLAAKPAGGDEQLRKALAKEVARARGVLGEKPAGAWWRRMKEHVDAVAKLAGME